MSWRQLPNAITLLRIASVAPIVWLLRAGEYRIAFWVALAAGASDGLDGWLAKRFDWRTRLGGLLDPVADKLLLNACYLGLWGAGHVPTWLAVLIVGRDLVIFGGAVGYHWLIAPLKANPTLLSKATTLAQIVLLVAWLLDLAYLPLGEGTLLAGAALVAALTAASGIDYVLRWSLRAWRQARARGNRRRTVEGR
ncbi:MAG TPA: CDP-alcohol phosphatidyltransferase family protein [Xanthomonadaceae bacterium]|nr:CDP-alcohol phosphatidyltransferase family protein [Xanthomonadaceae bacterium]